MKERGNSDGKKKPDTGVFDKYEPLIWVTIVLMAAAAAVFWLLTVW